MTLGQALVIGGLHFPLMRILILFGLARIILRRELSGITPNAIDGVLIAWVLASSFLYVLFDGTNVPVTGRLGYAYNAVGMYVLVRASVRTLDDIVLVVTACAVFIIPLAVLFVVENVTGRSPFAAFGGVPLVSEIRNGRVRCQGPFGHPILAGTFGATAMPLFVGLWVYSKGKRFLATFAIVSATTIVVTSGSSGPVIAILISTAGLACWSCRKFTRAIRWGLVTGVLGLAVVMKQPVWFVISRVSDLTGGSGWYRSALIDAALRHFDEWWLIGTGYTAHWMPTGLLASVSSADIVNEFVAQGVQGGLLALLLFVWLIVKCFKTIGAAVRSTADHSLKMRFVIWSMGCGLLAHVASFFSVSYFDQIIIFWYLQLGTVAALSSQAKALVCDRSPIRVQRGPVRKARLAHFRGAKSLSPSRISAGGKFSSEVGKNTLSFGGR
jgi:hypothetical protein